VGKGSIWIDADQQQLAERIDVYADAVADMFCAYLDSLAGGARFNRLPVCRSFPAGR
jgi:hypothetical protein